MSTNFTIFSLCLWHLQRPSHKRQWGFLLAPSLGSLWGKLATMCGSFRKAHVIKSRSHQQRTKLPANSYWSRQRKRSPTLSRDTQYDTHIEGWKTREFIWLSFTAVWKQVCSKYSLDYTPLRTHTYTTDWFSQFLSYFSFLYFAQSELLFFLRQGLTM
jgi:hypothetical protein